MRDPSINRILIDKYLSEYMTPKLHLGCGGNILAGWLNADYQPHSEQILQLDVSKAFPLADNVFHYVFSEHVIEHFTYPEGLAMLSECHRILKAGGRLRIATPDLAFLIDLHRPNKSDVQKAYLRWATENFIDTAPYAEDTFVINNFVRNWGHTFIYDEKVLRYSLETVGFTELARCEVGDSQDDELKGLENEGRMPAGFLRLESVVLEARKPRPDGMRS